MDTGQFDLVQTCGACPEQYDVFKDGEQVGYLRLRHGYFYAEFRGGAYETVYEAHPRGDGIFDSEEEREHHIGKALNAIARRIRGTSDDDVLVDLLAQELDRSPSTIRNALENLRERGLIVRID